jgi:tRNA nucleotidyltransferase (CCA-adding enzyme)
VNGRKRQRSGSAIHKGSEAEANGIPMEHRMDRQAKSQPLKATHFPHGADVGVCGTGPTLEAAFEQAALAMTGVMTDPANIDLREAVHIECAAPNAELLLIDWLNALIFEMATRGMIFGDFEVSIDGYRLHGIARGEAISIERHSSAVESKGPR